MHKIHIPSHLGIETPESLPFIELAVTLANKGYTLRNRMDGDLEAVQVPGIEIRDYNPLTDEDSFSA